MKTSLILKAIYETAWAILPDKLAEIVAVAERYTSGVQLAPEEIAAIKAGAQAARSRSEAQAGGGVAVLQLFGSIFPRANLMTEMSGATSAERFGATFRQALADPAVGAIVLDVDSPGGAVQGVDDLAAEIYKARGSKPILSASNHLMASAAYWIGTAADEVWVTSGGEVGSVGVFAVHDDYSAALEREGVKTTYISAGKYKVEGAPEFPLGDEARAAIQARVDDYYGMFVKAVARNRGVSVEDVRNGFGEGRVVGAREAVRLGMADQIGTLSEAIARAAKLMRSSGRAAAAETEIRQRRARRLRNEIIGSVEP